MRMSQGRSPGRVKSNRTSRFGHFVDLCLVVDRFCARTAPELEERRGSGGAAETQRYHIGSGLQERADYIRGGAGATR